MLTQKLLIRQMQYATYFWVLTAPNRFQTWISQHHNPPETALHCCSVLHKCLASFCSCFTDEITTSQSSISFLVSPGWQRHSLSHRVKKLHLNAVVNPCHAFLLQIIFQRPLLTRTRRICLEQPFLLRAMAVWHCGTAGCRLKKCVLLMGSHTSGCHIPEPHISEGSLVDP